MLIMGVSFYYLRDFKDFSCLQGFKDLSVFLFPLIKIGSIGVGGALILMPMPIFLLCCCRSKYKLLKTPSYQSELESDEPSQRDSRSTKSHLKPEKIKNRLTKISIDANLPLKLLL